ncbi:MAG: aminotransferase class I/II-fold pyridoxal phosphate-dependent enzyme [Myxococcota bacterium]
MTTSDRPALSRRLAAFGTTIFTEMTRLANEHRAINLAQGFPDFDGPAFVKDAAVAAIREGHGQYARMSGIPPLNAAIAAAYARDRGLSFDPDTEIVVTSGCTEAIFATLQGICEPGDEVVLFEPYYDSYRASVVMAGATPRFVKLHGPDWRYDPAELRAAMSPRTRAVLVNTPHNPTGKVFSRAELEEIASATDAILVADEVYEHLVYDGEHVPMASIAPERTVTLSSLGKTFSLTGWKIGWAAAPPPLAAAGRAAHQFVTFATATPLQWGAVAAMQAPPSFYAELRAGYLARRDLLAGALERIGFDVRIPAGTYFVCAGFRRFGFHDDVAFCRHLVERVGVAAIPPSVFYEHPDHDYVRFAFCKRDETLNAAIARLERLCA